MSAAATLNFLFMGFAAFFWGALSDRFGTRIVVLAGSLLLGLGLVAASQAQEPVAVPAFFGVLIGIAAGSFYAPMMALASAWIDKHRSLAVALVSAGMGVAPLTVAPSASLLITAYDWRTAMLVIGIAVLGAADPGLLPGAPGAARPRHAATRMQPTRRRPNGPWRRRCARRNSSRWRWRILPAARRIRDRSSTW